MGPILLLVSTVGHATPAQHVTVVMERLSPGVDVIATAVGHDQALVDPGDGLPRTTFELEPARFLQLQLTARARSGERRIYDGLVLLTDRGEDTVTFSYEDAQDARRIAASPSASVPYVRDDGAARTVAIAWGGLTLAWVVGMGVVWARKRR